MTGVGSVDEVVAAFRSSHGREPEVVVRAPGRVNLLGAHVDYNEGWVLPGAIDRGIWLAADRRPDRSVKLTAVNLGKRGSFDLDHLPPSPDHEGRETGWTDYPKAVAWALAAAGHELDGLEIAYGGDLPMAAGVSSSAALEMAFVLAWSELSGLEFERSEARAEIGRRAENDYLGVGSGIMDQYASLFGRLDHLVLIDCRTYEHELVPLPAGTCVLVADTGVRRQLVGSDFNQRRNECEQATELLSRWLPGVRALRDVVPADLEPLATELPAVLARRARHVVEECQRVQHGAAALRAGDLEAFGKLVIASHESSRDLYEVSIPELDLLAETAWSSPGCYGARLTGAGFGGCVTALVDEEAAPLTAKSLVSAFGETFGYEPAVFWCRVADGATVL